MGRKGGAVIISAHTLKFHSNIELVGGIKWCPWRSYCQRIDFFRLRSSTLSSWPLPWVAKDVFHRSQPPSLSTKGYLSALSSLQDSLSWICTRAPALSFLHLLYTPHSTHTHAHSTAWKSHTSRQVVRHSTASSLWSSDAWANAKRYHNSGSVSSSSFKASRWSAAFFICCNS